MNKLLKQLVQVLDERGIQLSSLGTVENTPGWNSIEVNKEISIEERGISYALYTKEGKLSASNYYSLTEALDVLANYLGRLKVGDTLVSMSGTLEFKVIAHADNNLYNLLNVKTNTLVYSEGTNLLYIYDVWVKPGDLRVK